MGRGWDVLFRVLLWHYLYSTCTSWNKVNRGHREGTSGGKSRIGWDGSGRKRKWEEYERKSRMWWKEIMVLNYTKCVLIYVTPCGLKSAHYISICVFLCITTMALLNRYSRNYQFLLQYREISVSDIVTLIFLSLLKLVLQFVIDCN